MLLAALRFSPQEDPNNLVYLQIISVFKDGQRVAWKAHNIISFYSGLFWQNFS